jgi:hypothetical protein
VFAELISQYAIAHSPSVDIITPEAPEQQLAYVGGGYY